MAWRSNGGPGWRLDGSGGRPDGNRQVRCKAQLDGAIGDRHDVSGEGVRPARETGCAVYGLDSELDKTARQNALWQRVVTTVRAEYKGHLTTTAATYDGEEQSRYFEALMTAYWEQSWWMGAYWWKWDEQNDRPQFRDDPRGDRGFAVWGKPAQRAMRRWYGRPERRA
jgi:hypothetical protein